MFTEEASLTKRPFYEQMKSFRKPINSKHSKYSPKFCFICIVQNSVLSVVTNYMAYFLTFETKSGHFKPSDNLFRGQKAGFGTALGPKRAWFAHLMGVLESLEGGPPMIQKWVSDASLVNIGQLDHYLEPNLLPRKTYTGAKWAL